MIRAVVSSLAVFIAIIAVTAQIDNDNLNEITTTKSSEVEKYAAGDACDCAKGTCGCCHTFSIPLLPVDDFTGCVNIGITEDYKLSVKIIGNNNTLVDVYVKPDDPEICKELPVLGEVAGAKICVVFSKIDWSINEDKLSVKTCPKFILRNKIKDVIAEFACIEIKN